MRDLEILERVLHVVGLDAALGHQFGSTAAFFRLGRRGGAARPRAYLRERDR